MTEPVPISDNDHAGGPLARSGESCWVVTDGKAGMAAQALGLAEAVGLPFIEKVIRTAPPWSLLPAGLWPPGVFGLTRGSDPLAPPWPDLLIACGRHGVGPALAVRRASGGRTFTVYIQHPRMAADRFDLIVAPAHDRLEGPNVVVTAGAVHRVSPRRLAEVRARDSGFLDALPKPRIAVSIGGDNRAYRLDRDTMLRIAGQLRDLARATGGGLAVTPSRRTGAENEAVLRAALADVPAIVWDGTGENPYFRFLALADAVLVTCDSVNMISEACATGRPVHVLDLPRIGNAAKFEAFHAEMRAIDAARPFRGAIESWTPTPLDEAGRAAAILRRRMAERQAADRAD